MLGDQKGSYFCAHSAGYPNSSIRTNAMNASLDTLAELMPFAERRVEEVSQWSVGQHIEHTLLATIAISEALVDSTAGEKRQRFSLLRWILFTLGWFPRGSAKSPEPAIPEDSPSQERLEELIQTAGNCFEKAQGADPQQWFRHFVFGVLDKRTTLRLITVHNRHHVKIIRDILRSSNESY